MTLSEASSILYKNGVKVYPTWISSKKGWYMQYELLNKVQTYPKVVSEKMNSKDNKRLINEAHEKTIIYVAEKIKGKIKN